jgi:hypothetical protein
MRALIALTLVAASTAHAGTHEVSFGGTSRALHTDSANALTEDSLDGSQLGYEHALELPLLDGMNLWATGTFGWGLADGTMFQTLSTSLDTLSFTIGGRARYPLGRWLNATARLDLGASRASVAISPATTGHTASDAGWGALAQGALGVEVVLIRSRSGFTMGLRAELGYVAASPISLTATPDSSSDDDTLQLEMSAASLGSLNLSGKLFAASLTSQF